MTDLLDSMTDLLDHRFFAAVLAWELCSKDQQHVSFIEDLVYFPYYAGHQ